MNDTQIRKAVLFKARETPTATPLDEMVVEYDVQDPDPTMTDLDILMVAAPRAIVESRADAVRDAGLIVEAVDLEGFALMRALVECSPDRSILQKTVAIVSLGHTFTEFNIVTRGSFSFPRSIPIGGSHFNHTLQNSLGLDPKAVEEMKHFLDLRSLLSVDVASGNATPEQMLRPGMDELVREITRSINYYQSQFAEGAYESSIDQLLLCGGGARMTGMKEYVAARLRLDVEVADPLDSFFAANLSPEIDLVRDYAPALVCALGLALYCLVPK
jgi:type IV pilus assembly protein PilM